MLITAEQATTINHLIISMAPLIISKSVRAHTHKTAVQSLSGATVLSSCQGDILWQLCVCKTVKRCVCVCLHRYIYMCACVCVSVCFKEGIDFTIR